MEPITAMMLMGGLNAGLGLLKGKSDKKAAKKQREREMRMQMARDLVSAAGGQGLAGLAPITQIPSSGGAEALQAGASSMAPFLNMDVQAGIKDKQSTADYLQQLELEKLRRYRGDMRATGGNYGFQDVA